MMSSRGPDSGGLKVPRRGKKSATMQYAMFGVVAVVLLIVVLIVFLGLGKKDGGSEPRASRSTRQTTAREPAARRDRDTREERSSRRSRSRDRDRDSDRSSSGRSSRSRSSDYSGSSYSGSSRRSSRQSGVPVLNGTDGQNTAMFSTRVVRMGEEIDGRRVVSVGPTSVTVEYRTQTYVIRVGDPLYQQ